MFRPQNIFGLETFLTPLEEDKIPQMYNLENATAVCGTQTQM